MRRGGGRQEAVGDLPRHLAECGRNPRQRRQADRLTQIGRALRELGIHWIAAYSPQAKGRVERSFGTDQDRLVKHLRLAKVKSMRTANEFLEKEYWPEWNERFARRPAAMADLHRPLTPQIDLASSLSHVESRVIGNDYTISFAGRRFQIARGDVAAGMKRQPLRVELRLDGSLKARYEGRYVEISECGAKLLALRKNSRVLRHRGAFADCFGANPVASALGKWPQARPRRGSSEHATGGLKPPAQNRNFLLCLDTSPCAGPYFITKST